MLVIGAGHIGRAIAASSREISLVSARDVIRGRPLHILEPHDTIVHAGGPAGERSSLADPAGAFAAHYTLVNDLVDWCLANPGVRRLILLGTVASDTGYYGPLKRAALKLAGRRLGYGDLLIIECGQVIGPGAGTDGVVGQFVCAAAAGNRLKITGEGLQTIRYTPLSQLVDLVGAVEKNWPQSKVISPVSAPVRVQDVARLCVQLAGTKFGINNVMFYDAILGRTFLNPGPSYEDPSGKLLPVDDLSDVLLSWMRTMVEPAA